MPKHSTTQKILSLAFLLITLILISGCGTKGDLYIPEQQYPQKET